MAFEWLVSFYRKLEKPEDYAERTLAAYRLGMQSGGAIVGIRIVTGEDCCQEAHEISGRRVYHPDEAPHLPLPGCPKGRFCQCVYRPVMCYEDSRENE